MRAGGAEFSFYTKTGVEPVIAEGKEHKDFNGQTCFRRSICCGFIDS